MCIVLNNEVFLQRLGIRDGGDHERIGARQAESFWLRFLIFSDYGRGSIRLGAIMEIPVIYVFTHDSIEDQDEAYRESVLPSGIRARVSVEQSARFGWERYAGLDGARIGMRTFGESAPSRSSWRSLALRLKRLLLLSPTSQQGQVLENRSQEPKEQPTGGPQVFPIIGLCQLAPESWLLGSFLS